MARISCKLLMLTSLWLSAPTHATEIWSEDLAGYHKTIISSQKQKTFAQIQWEQQQRTSLGKDAQQLGPKEAKREKRKEKRLQEFDSDLSNNTAQEQRPEETGFQPYVSRKAKKKIARQNSKKQQLHSGPEVHTGEQVNHVIQSVIEALDNNTDDYEVTIHIKFSRKPRKKNNHQLYEKHKYIASKRLKKLSSTMNDINIKTQSYIEKINENRKAVQKNYGEFELFQEALEGLRAAEESIALTLFPEHAKISGFLSEPVFSEGKNDVLKGGWERYKNLEPLSKLQFIIGLENYIFLADKVKENGLDKDSLHSIRATYENTLHALIHIFVCDQYHFQSGLHHFVNVYGLSQKMIEYIIHEFNADSFKNDQKRTFRNRVLHRLFQKQKRDHVNKGLLHKLLNIKSIDDNPYIAEHFPNILI